MYSVAEQVRTTAEIQYSQFLDLYNLRLLDRIYHAAFIMPALTASSISGEQGTPDAGTDADDHDGAA